MQLKAEQKRKQWENLQRELQEKEELRKKQNEETILKVKEVLNAKPLYKQFEEKYK